MAKKKKKSAKAKSQPEVFLTSCRELGVFQSVKQAFGSGDAAKEHVEKWVGTDRDRSASLHVFGKDGKLQNRFRFGPTQITEFCWSDQDDD